MDTRVLPTHCVLCAVDSELQVLAWRVLADGVSLHPRSLCLVVSPHDNPCAFPCGEASPSSYSGVSFSPCALGPRCSHQAVNVWDALTGKTGYTR